jgi:hypothetical protein
VLRAVNQNPGTDDQISPIQNLIAKGLERGAPAVGIGIQYIPGASRWEILQTFRTAAPYHASLHPHIRYVPHERKVAYTRKRPERSGFTSWRTATAETILGGAPRPRRLHAVYECRDTAPPASLSSPMEDRAVVRMAPEFTRYEYYLENFTGMLHLACALILLRHL